MKVCEIVYERDINGRLIKKSKIYGGEEFIQEVPAKEVESVMEIIKYHQKKARFVPTIADLVYKKGKEYE